MIEFKFKHLKELRTSVNQLKSSGPKIPGMIGFKFKHLKELQTSVNQPKSSGPRTPGMIEFKFKNFRRTKTYSINTLYEVQINWSWKYILIVIPL